MPAHSTNDSIGPAELTSVLRTAVAFLDFAWASLGVLVTVTVLPVIVVVVAMLLQDDFVIGSLAKTWRELPLEHKALAVATLAACVAAPVSNAYLFVGALRLLRGRSNAERCIRIWAFGVIAIFFVDLVWILTVLPSPWSWIAFTLSMGTPIWAVMNLVVLARYRSSVRAAPVASGASA